MKIWLVVKPVVVPLVAAILGVLVDAGVLDHAVGHALVQLLRSVLG